MGTVIMNILIRIAEIALFTFIGFCAGRQYQMMKQTKRQMKDAEELTGLATKLLGLVVEPMTAVSATHVAKSKDASSETAGTNEQKEQDEKL